MRKHKYVVELTDNEFQQLKTIISSGTHTAKEILRAHILLSADSRHSEYHERKEIAAMYHCHYQTVQTVCTQYVTEGFERAVFRKKRETPPVPSKVTGEVEAKIIALCCSEVPKGHACWTLRLLAEKAVELEIIDSISHNCVGDILKKSGLKTS